LGKTACFAPILTFIRIKKHYERQNVCFARLFGVYTEGSLKCSFETYFPILSDYGNCFIIFTFAKKYKVMTEITSLSQLDLNGRYSYADYLTWKFEQAVELIKGHIVPMAAPSRRHQGISWQLSGMMFNIFSGQKCKAYAAPFDVRLLDKSKSKKANIDVYTVIQPDICIICDESKLDDSGCQGAPDLVIEILSPGNSKKEMRTKKQLYEENGILEYWVIDPERETVHQFVLGDSEVYAPPIIYVSEEVVYCSIFEELIVPLDKLFL
jgi:Uma2 family endonuclease